MISLRTLLLWWKKCPFKNNGLCKIFSNWIGYNRKMNVHFRCLVISSQSNDKCLPDTYRCLPEEQQNHLKTSMTEYFKSVRNPITFYTGRMMSFGTCSTWRKKQPAPQKDLSSRQHSWHCHSSSGMFKDPVAMFWKLSAIDFAFDLGNKWRKFRAVVAMKHFLLRSVKNSTITWITSAVLGWCGKGSFWGCVGGTCREGGYRHGFWDKHPEAFPCLTKPIPVSSRTEPPLAKAGPISNNGSTSGKKTLRNWGWERGVRIY